MATSESLNDNFVINLSPSKQSHFRKISLLPAPYDSAEQDVTCLMQSN